MHLKMYVFNIKDRYQTKLNSFLYLKKKPTEDPSQIIPQRKRCETLRFLLRLNFVFDTNTNTNLISH